MTVKELRDFLNCYIETNDLLFASTDKQFAEHMRKERENQQVLICDDGMQPKHFAIKFAASSLFSRLTKEAVIEKHKVKKTKKEEVHTFGNWHFDPKKGIIPGKPIYKDVEYTETVPVQVKPAEYVPEKIVMLVSDLTAPEK